MYLVDGNIISEGWGATAFFNGKISVSSNCGDIQKELQCLKYAMSLVTEGVTLFPPKSSLLSLNVYFLEHNTATFSIDEDALGSYNQFIIIPIKRWRKYNYSLKSMMFIILEEFCHAVWQIPDGPPMEARMNELFRVMGLDMTYSDLLADLIVKEEGSRIP